MHLYVLMQITVLTKKSESSCTFEKSKSFERARKNLIAGPHPAIDSENPDQAGFSGSLIVVNLKPLRKLNHG